MRLGNERIGPLTPLLLLLLLLLLVEPEEACGPGRRRRQKRLTPLVFKQHVPNVSENTLGASGLEDGRIRRGDAKFKDLVVNKNKNIVFKNEEGTGADRLMSKRCNEKLNSLAVLVMNQWKNERLRVTEAWDENNSHAYNSLHYEGRAVDITTEDQDKVKYGMLARLAVEAGFDWVYYESRRHVHCSVKSDSSVAIKIGGCFPAESQVVLPSGQTMSMSDLQVGHSVLALNSQGQLIYSEVIGFLDKSPHRLAMFYTLTTESGRSITLTAKHLIHTHDALESSSTTTHPPPSSSYPSLKFAEDVKIGDYIVVADEYSSKLSTQRTESDITGNSATSTSLHRVVSIHKETKEGYFAPLTVEGTIVVNGVAASCYAFLNRETFVHSLFAPIRAFHAFKTFVSSLWELAVTKFTWLEPAAEWVVSLFEGSTTESSTEDIYSNSQNRTIVTTSDGSFIYEAEADKDGAHWYARLLYSVAINVIGMDIFISM